MGTRRGKRPVGRPKKTGPMLRPIQVLLTEKERALFDKEAQRVGLPTSTWMRLLCREAAGLPKP